MLGTARVEHHKAGGDRLVLTTVGSRRAQSAVDRVAEIHEPAFARWNRQTLLARVQGGAPKPYGVHG